MTPKKCPITFIGYLCYLSISSQSEECLNKNETPKHQEWIKFMKDASYFSSILLSDVLHV